MLTRLVPSLATLPLVPSSVASQKATEYMLLNTLGPSIYETLMGHQLPENVRADLKALRVKFAIATGAADPTTVFVPRRPQWMLGDLLHATAPDNLEELNVWAEERLREVAMSGVPTFAIVGVPEATAGAAMQRGHTELRRFHDNFVVPHVADPTTWTLSESALLVLLIYSGLDVHTRIHTHFHGRLTQGVIVSLRKYMLGNVLATRSLAITTRFPVVLLLYIFAHLAN